MLYAAVNAMRSAQKATNWSGIENGIIQGDKAFLVLVDG
jgi:hypothetical protein